jgi:hypothetical protein
MSEPVTRAAPEFTPLTQNAPRGRLHSRPKDNLEDLGESDVAWLIGRLEMSKADGWTEFKVARLLTL